MPALSDTAILSNTIPLIEPDGQGTTDNPIVIIGSGMAGYSLARELRKLNADITIILVCQDAGDSYAKPTLSNALAQGKTADKIATASAATMANNLQIQIYNYHRVIHIDTADQTIVLHPIDNPNTLYHLPYANLVLATGASPRLLPNVIADQNYIFAVNHLADYQAFQRRLHAQKTTSKQPLNIAIIGAGLIGCEFANDIISQNNTISDNAATNTQADLADAVSATESNLPYQVTVFDTASLPMSQQLPPVASQALQTALTSAGVVFKLDTRIQQVKVTDSMAKLDYLDSQNQLQHSKADMVLVAIGLVANTTLAEKAGLAVAHSSTTDYAAKSRLPRTARQGILVDDKLQTSDSHIYALGDCANVMGSYMPYVMPLLNQAKALAKTLVDQYLDKNSAKTAVSYPAMPIAIKTPSLPLVVLPVSAQHHDEQLHWQQQTTSDGMILTAHIEQDPNALLGFVLVGKEAGKQRMALTKQVTNWL